MRQQLQMRLPLLQQLSLLLWACCCSCLPWPCCPCWLCQHWLLLLLLQPPASHQHK
jgi:hypothetical protein